MSLSTLEAKVIAEWNLVRGFVATHQIVTVVAVAVVAFLAGKIL